MEKFLIRERGIFAKFNEERSGFQAWTQLSTCTSTTRTAPYQRRLPKILHRSLNCTKSDTIAAPALGNSATCVGVLLAVAEPQACVRCAACTRATDDLLTLPQVVRRTPCVVSECEPPRGLLTRRHGHLCVPMHLRVPTATFRMIPSLLLLLGSLGGALSADSSSQSLWRTFGGRLSKISGLLRQRTLIRSGGILFLLLMLTVLFCSPKSVSVINVCSYFRQDARAYCTLAAN